MRKKSKPDNRLEAVEDYREAVLGLSEAVIEQLNEHHDEDAFERYAKKIRCSLASDADEQGRRLQRGYQVLLDLLAKQS